MNSSADKMIALLSPEINRKCEEIKEIRKEKLHTRLFFLLCAAVIVIPPMFIFFGLRLTFLLTPVVFMGMALLVLSPILTNQKGGSTYEQA